MHRLMLVARSRKFRPGPHRIDQGRVVGRNDRAMPVGRRIDRQLPRGFAFSPHRSGGFLAPMLASARNRSEGRLMGMLASAPGRCGRWRRLGPASSRGWRGGRESQLLQADIERSSHLAPALPLARSRPRRWTLGLAGGTTRLRRVRLIRLLVLEGLPEALQFKNQRRALRPDSVILGLAVPA